MFYNPTIEEKFAKDIASVLTNGNLETISSYIDLRKSNSKNKIDLKETVHICVASNKGGVGKTLTSFQLAWFLNVLGYKVLLADLDAQANITCSILEDQDKVQADVGLYEVLCEQASIKDIIAPLAEEFDVLGGKDTLSEIDYFLRNKEIENAEEYIDDEDSSENIYHELYQLFKTIGKDYDFVIYDTNPETNKVNRLSLQVADLTIVPMQAKESSAKGYNVTAKEMAASYININRDLDDLSERVKIILNLVTAIPEEVKDKKVKAVYKMFKENIFENYIDTSYALGEASDMGLPCFLHPEISLEAIKGFMTFTNEVLSVLAELNGTKEVNKNQRRYAFA